MVRDVRFDILADDRTRAAFASVRRNLGDTRRQVTQINAGITQSSKAVSGLLAGLGAGIAIGGLAQIPGIIRDIVKEGADLVDLAHKIGLTTDALQELRFQSEQNGSSAEELDSALEQFSR